MTDVVDVLRRIRSREVAAAPGQRCEMCGEDLPGEHRHVVQLDHRSLMCTCTGCYLLFTHHGAAQGRYRSVPDRYLYAADFGLAEATWEALQIPVGMAFAFRSSVTGTTTAFYPSPAGATECLLPLDAWEELVQSHPVLAGLQDDVEALLLRRTADAFEAYLVPIDACYELVGRVRLEWRGFDGGEQAKASIEAFFDALRSRSRALA